MRSEVCLLSLVLAAVVPCAAQTSRLEGEVTDSLTGAPVARAHVTLSSNSHRYGAFTDAEGKFLFDNLAPDSYQATAERVGFKAPFNIGSDSQVKLEAGKQHDALKIELTPLGAIAGRVLDRNGEPVEGITVVPQRSWSSSHSARTDENGQFRIGGLAPGKYRILALNDDAPLPPEIRTDGTVEVHYAATWYPGLLTAKSATQIEVQPGTETGGIEIRLVSVPIVGIRGKIDGLPAGARDMTLNISRDERDIEIAPDGSFEVWRLDPGHYRLWVSGHSRDGKEFRTATEEIDVGASSIENIRLTVVSPSTILGRLEFDSDQTRRKLRQPETSPKVILNSIDLEGGSYSADIGDDDKFRLDGLLAGRYRVSLGQDVYVKSLRLGQSESDGAVLDLRHGSGGAELSLTVRSTMGAVSGTVRDEKGMAAKAFVALLPPDEVPDEGIGFSFSFNFSPTQADGTYLLDGIVPGKYKLIAFDKIPDLETLDFEDAVEEIEVRQGEKIARDLTRQSADVKQRCFTNSRPEAAGSGSAIH